jgi:hypothetical protein
LFEDRFQALILQGIPLSFKKFFLGKLGGICGQFSLDYLTLRLLMEHGSEEAKAKLDTILSNLNAGNLQYFLALGWSKFRQKTLQGVGPEFFTQFLDDNSDFQLVLPSKLVDLPSDDPDKYLHCHLTVAKNGQFRNGTPNPEHFFSDFFGDRKKPNREHRFLILKLFPRDTGDVWHMWSLYVHPFIEGSTANQRQFTLADASGAVLEMNAENGSQMLNFFQWYYDTMFADKWGPLIGATISSLQTKKKNM